MSYRTRRYDIYDLDYIRNQAIDMADEAVAAQAPRDRLDRTCRYCDGSGLDHSSNDTRDAVLGCPQCHGTGWAQL